MNTKKTIMAASAAVLAMGTMAYAAPGMMRAEGPITLEEAQAKSAEMFERMDVNDDGQLDKADREAHRAKRFSMLDTDGNGSISKEEFAAMHEMRGKHGDREHGKRGHRGGMHMMAKMADTDNDGVITRAEFDAGVAAHFAKVDTDGDGTITDAERKAAHDKMRERFKQAREARAAN